MTIENTPAMRLRYLGTGSLDTFAYPSITGRTTQDSEVKVTVDDVVQVLDTDYQITGANVDFSIGTTPASGAVVEVSVFVTPTQDTDYVHGATLAAATLEENYDLLTLAIQQLHERTGGTGFRLSSAAIKIGQYTGNGTNPNEVNIVPFRPDIVFIMADGVNDIYMAIATEGTNWPTASSYTVDIKKLSTTGSAYLTDAITLTSDGFDLLTADSAVNTNSTVYSFVAIKMP